MFRRRRKRPDPGCDHHWHVIEHGWQCCGCPGLIWRDDPPPGVGGGQCRESAERAAAGICAWLAPPRGLLHGHRPGRRGGRTHAPGKVSRGG